MINFKLIGKRIKSARIEKGFTQETFSEKIGISTEHLSRIETGSYRPSLGLIEKISETLNVSEEALMFGKQKSDTKSFELAEKIESLSDRKRRAIKEIIELISE